jgi:hypothetical protein
VCVDEDQKPISTYRKNKKTTILINQIKSLKQKKKRYPFEMDNNNLPKKKLHLEHKVTNFHETKS